MKGIVLRTFGAGNAPDNNPDFLAALREAHDMGIVIVNTTQCIRAYHSPSIEFQGFTFLFRRLDDCSIRPRLW